jgi:hypothetical protein
MKIMTQNFIRSFDCCRYSELYVQKLKKFNLDKRIPTLKEIVNYAENKKIKSPHVIKKDIRLLPF